MQEKFKETKKKKGKQSLGCPWDSLVLGMLNFVLVKKKKPTKIRILIWMKTVAIYND